MAREEYEISLEWAEFSRSAQTGIAGWKSGVHDYGHTEKFGRLVLGVRGYQPGFSAVDQLTGSRYTFAPTPRKVGWLSVTWEECNETSTRILSFSIEFRDLRRTGYDGLRKALSIFDSNWLIPTKQLG
jgi:hypothetical protein